MPQFFNAPVTELAAARRSVRTYKGGLEPEIKQQIAEYMATVTGIIGRPVRLALVDAGAPSNNARIGTYGIISGVRDYIATVVPQGDNSALIELGYVLEKTVLFATSLGLGTVWLGGTFNRSQFAKAVGLAPNELLPIVVPIGHMGEKMSLREQLMRRVSNADRRREWHELFFDGGIHKPLEKSLAGDLQDALEAVRRAPSAMNAQPWRIVRSGDGSYAFYKSANQPQGHFDMQMIDMGIAMCHFNLAAAEAGQAGRFFFEKKEPHPHNLKFIAVWKEQ